MATYSSDAFTKNAPIPQLGHAGELKSVTWTVACTAAPSTSDTLNFGYVPANASLKLAVLEATDMDTNGSPALTLNVGDSGSASRLFAASTVGQAGTVSTSIAAAGAGYKFTDKTLITGTAAVNAATGAAGTVYLTLFYTIEP